MSMEKEVLKISTSAPVVVFSKTYCGFCSGVKSLFEQLEVENIKVLELDTMPDGPSIQDTLAKLTGQRTVPSVFIGGKFIGGMSETRKFHSKGLLIPALKEAGAVH
uniref:Glutaredoxin domain-containing protein n=1 Tax=Timspurckia oligopyrenoides TaxID=708627 RepID=A0A7S0ZGI4_9RHOD|mmetsp:Transcript_4370/g.7671  ORF Transcript_4370/g.7671 Transcript_4370/m.7671 type:complete len:106 (+) Transcript_4370:74-391(+)|eukprot:CAMPEP_0182441712 /NCGR_PEP_ID=MMETSP1172-20130603/691_1 /TAXON_ID=708627 /ORGANISM="Timspurckia oligopyrenoides, Strain CCMP3278" /LENGTH=105 /DNA_ID=CAMNT_0024636173 /DNA_START=47 /DNA_END=364 /DNA_ORIENTATION=-